MDKYLLRTPEEKQMFILSSTSCSENRKKTNKKLSRKQKSFEYFFVIEGVKIRVCKDFFLKTLCISSQKVYYTHLNKDPVLGFPRKSLKGSRNRSRLEAEKKVLREHIHKFPVVESHYARAKTSREYLEGDLNCSMMYDMYVQEQREKGNRVLSKSMYRTIFNTSKKHFRKPKTDRCSVCEKVKVKKRQHILLTREELLAYTAHRLQVTNLREERDSDRDIDSEDTAVITFDLQNVITCPRADVGDHFYKRKLSVYNLTGHSKVNGEKDVYCVVWNECHAGRGGNEIASSVLKVLKDVCVRFPLVRKIITWSDSCVSQNRNSFISTAILSFLYSNPHLESITLKYSIPGHSCCQEVDNTHSQLEKKFKQCEYYSPLSLIRLIKGANRRKQFIVKQLSPKDVLDFGTCAKNLAFTVIPYFKVHVLEFKCSFNVRYKANHLDEFTTVNILKKTKNLANRYITLGDILAEPKRIKMTPLKELKANDIRSMLGNMPLIDQVFFESLLNIK